MNKYFITLLFLSLCLPTRAQSKPFETADFRVTLNEKGYVVSFFDKQKKREYHPGDQATPLLRLSVSDKIEEPISMKADGNMLTLYYAQRSLSAVVTVVKKSSYISFELTAISDPQKIDWIVWGPFATSIREIIGETVGVVRNHEFALGIQALNVKTLGGYPTELNDNDPSFNIFDTESLIDIKVSEKNEKLYRGQTAKATDKGSVLQAYTRNRAADRIIPNWGHTQYTSPAYADGGIKGSRIALFGCAPTKVLETIRTIEQAENLPHPKLNGEWIKTARDATASYLIIGFSEQTLDDALELTAKAGLKYLYHGHPFKSWGSYSLLEDAFPQNWISMKNCVDRANAKGIHLGVHTLSNFINTNDPYVTPIPDKRLAVVGTSTLTQGIDDATQIITLESPVFFNQMQNNSLRSVRIGNEIIRYKEVSAAAPWQLLECIRGAYGTKPAHHAKGVSVDKLMDHGYKVFLTNTELSEEIAHQLARFCNETGIRQISFDGLEGTTASAMGQYAINLFTKAWYEKLTPALKGSVINDASGSSHYNWHINTRYNWGEPWYAGFRESQTQYRLMNQDYFRRNYLPSMLGWFSMNAQTSVEDAEWLLARAAGFDAGFAFNVNLKQVSANEASDAIFRAIRTWETARMLGVFSPEQKKRMENIQQEFHLEQLADDKWELSPLHIQRFTVSPTPSSENPGTRGVAFHNPYAEQSLSLTLQLKLAKTESAGPVRSIKIRINESEKVSIPFGLEPDQILKITHQNMAQLYDKNWRLLQSISLPSPIPKVQNGVNTVFIEAVVASHSHPPIYVECKTVGTPELLKKPASPSKK